MQKVPNNPTGNEDVVKLSVSMKNLHKCMIKIFQTMLEGFSQVFYDYINSRLESDLVLDSFFILG